MIFPAGEITDMTLALYVTSPTRIADHDGVIQANGKKNVLFLDPFPVKGMFYLVLNPITLDRVLGENQKNLIVKSDRFIDHWTNFITNLHVMWGKPAPNTSSLKIVVNPLSKFIVLVTVANKTRIVFDALTG